MLFCDDETGFADSLVMDGDQLYGITCPASGFLSSTCLLARAPLEDALDLTQWQAWNGSSFGALGGATPIFEGALNPRFFHDDYAAPGWRSTPGRSVRVRPLWLLLVPAAGADRRHRHKRR